MTTPMNVYAKLAAEYGGVDVTDKDAVNDFFETGVYELSEEVRMEIIEKLFAGMDSNDELTPEDLEINMDDVPLPNPSNYKRRDE